MKKFRIPAILRNKYVVSGAAFMIWLLFLDRNNIFTQYQLYSEVKEQESQKNFYKREIERTRQDQYELLSSPEKLEKFAREKYRMKKDDEDLFIIPDPAPQKD